MDPKTVEMVRVSFFLALFILSLRYVIKPPKHRSREEIERIKREHSPMVLLPYYVVRMRIYWLFATGASLLGAYLAWERFRQL